MGVNMAAGSFTLTKLGDTYRIFYSAKDFTTGLTNVQAVPYNPSGVAQTPVVFTELGTSGVYYYNFDTTGKALGTWSFLVDSSTKKAPSYTRIQIIDGDTLDDTIWEKLDTMVDGLVSDMSTVKSDVSIIKTDTSDIKGAGWTAPDNLQNIKSIVDAIESAVSGIQNNTSTTVALPESMLVPSTGTTTYKIYVNTYNGTGTMEDPDDQDPGATTAYVSVSAANQGGTDRSTNLGGLSASTWETKKWMTRVTEGRFSCTYAVSNTHAVEELIFTFDYEEAGTAQVDKSVQRADSAGDLNNKYFWIASEAKSWYVWFNVSSGGTDPNPTVPALWPATKQGVEIAITTGDIASAVATAVRNACTIAMTDKTISGTGADVIATHNAPFDLKDCVDGNASVTCTTPTQGVEGGYRIIDRSSRTASSADDYTSRFDAIDTQLDSIEGKTDTISGNVNDIETIVASASHGNAALKVLIDAIQADIDDGTNGLTAIKNAVTGNYNVLTNGTYGLSALKTILDSITSYVDGVEVDLTAIKGTSWVAADNLHNISDYVKPGGIAI
jgi:hypothetical protein